MLNLFSERNFKTVPSQLARLADFLMLY